MVLHVLYDADIVASRNDELQPLPHLCVYHGGTLHLGKSLDGQANILLALVPARVRAPTHTHTHTHTQGHTTYVYTC